MIGNSDYLEISPLVNPRNDAQDVAERLQVLGFTLHGNRVHYNLGERELLGLKETFAATAESAEIAFLYFAGHGMQFDGDPHLLPVDIPDASLSIVQREAVGLNSLLNDLAGKAELTIAVFDACRLIPDFNRQIRRATRGGRESAWRGLSRPTVQMDSTLIAYSGGSGELVADGDGRNSPYTTLLLENLDQEIANPGRNDAANFFSEVAYQFRQQYRGQRPEVIIQGVRPNRFFLSDQQRHEKPVGPKTGRLESGGLISSESLSLVELEWWNLAKEGGSAASYGSYLERYPEGEFAEIARIRLSRLEDTALQSAVEIPQTTESTPVPSSIAIVESEKEEPAVSRSDWLLAQRAGTLLALRRFLELCDGICEQQSEADARVKYIEQQQTQFIAHIRKNELTSGRDGTALEAILAIERVAPSEPWIADARQQVAERYALLARQQQRAGKFQAAQRLVSRGLSVASVESLEKLQIEIDQRLAARKQQTADPDQSSNPKIVTLGETSVKPLIGPRITLPTGAVKQSGVAISVKANIASEDKIKQALLFWSTAASFTAPKSQRMYSVSEKSNGTWVYSGRFTPPRDVKEVYYYIAVTDRKGRKSTIGSASSPRSYQLPGPKTSGNKTASSASTVTQPATQKINYGKNCEKGNIFTKSSTKTNITDRRKVENSRGLRVPYGVVSAVKLSENKTYYIYTTWGNIKSKKYEFEYGLYDSKNNSAISRRAYGFDARGKVEGGLTTWTTWYDWKPPRNSPTGKYTHVICEGGKRHVMTFQVMK